MQVESDRRKRVGTSAVVTTFRSLLLEFRDLAATEGLEVRAFDGAGPRHFEALEPSRQDAVVDHFRAYVEAARAVKGAGKFLKDDLVFLWSMLSRMGLRPSSQLFGELTEDDLVEVYTIPDHTQVYRNLFYYGVCSYTLDDILCRPWWELYDRDESITDGILEYARVVASMRKTELIVCDSPRHVVKETASEGRFESDCQHKIVAPLFDSQGRVAAAVSVFRMYAVDGYVDGRRRAVWRPQ